IWRPPCSPSLPYTTLFRSGRRDDVPDLLASADVLVSTSAWEGQPINVQEALAAGVPVVATDVGGTGEVTGDAARLVPYPDPDARSEEHTSELQSRFDLVCR